MSRDPDGFPLDPDPLYVHDDPDPRPSLPDGVPGPALVLVIVGIPLLICAAVGIAWLAGWLR